MKKNIGIFWTAAIFISFCFTNSSLAQNAVSTEDSGVELIKEKDELDIELKNLNRIEVALGKRLNKLKTEPKAISQEYAALKAGFSEYAQRKTGYDSKCAGQTFHADNPAEMQIEGECRGEKSWLESNYRSLTERKRNNEKRDEDYKKNFAQLKLDSETWQAKMDAWKEKMAAWQAKMAAWKGNKSALITKIAQDTIRAFKNQEISAWVLKNVYLEIRTDPGQQGQLCPWASGSNLIFTEDFLKETKAVRDNLIAFEAGKVFFTIMKDELLKDGRTLEAWFSEYSPKYNSVIEKMKENMQEAMNQKIFDPAGEWPSAFGYIFRTQALQLKGWNQAIREFRTQFDPLIKGNSPR
ncbi:MAG: hypothetical protein PHF11_06010 [Candidatus Omnitrophica bacterium]|nr:hypothetical protein [Candidatus Omnitrophota bacterium]